MNEPTGKTAGGADGLERRIIVYGHAGLRTRAAAVTQIDQSIQQLVEALFATMYAAPGIGLAAPQVNESVRVFVANPARVEERFPALAAINPEILEYAGGGTIEEGCLSIPEVYADLNRPERILARYLDLDGKQHERGFDGLMARVIQHETDHLDGKLFVDRLSPMRRSLLGKKLREIASSQREGSAGLR